MSDIKRLFRKKQKACNEAKANKKTKDWDHYKSIKKKCQIECRKTYNNYVSTMLNDDIKSNQIISVYNHSSTVTDVIQPALCH